MTKRLRVDASRRATEIEEGTSSVAPDGRSIGMNARYLTRDGLPWLPVMGEVHFARLPETQCNDSLAKVKSAGVDIVASYVMWRYHEPRAGHYDWSGRLNLRRFVECCAQRDLLFFVRIGPWVHAEVRYGGLPNWIVDKMPTRSDDPLYLDHVRRFYGEIARQLKRLLWKDGGPVIGLQIENEYNLTGTGQGREHIASLKRLACEAGLDVPFYTVTGWDNAVFPPGDVTPVFGGYPDLPWGTSTDMSPPNEVYSFRFGSRVGGGDLGAQTHNHEPGDADAVAHRTPFLGAEYGGGVPTMYRRRPVLDAQDIAAMLPVQLGSGVNLYGYYMLHGGRNPPGDLDDQESTSTGGYNDLPIVHYDFQAPFGANGEANAVLGALRPMHFFLQEWGSVLARCSVHAPDLLPYGPGDLDTPRFSVRSQGDTGFLFFNRHVRQHSISACDDVQVNIELETVSITLPREPVNIAPGTSFIWPLGMSLGSMRLLYATAQPVTRLDDNVYVFAETARIAPEFAFGDARVVRPAIGQPMRIECSDGTYITLLVLSRDGARRATVLTLDGARRLIVTEAHAFERDGHVIFRSMGAASFDVAVYPPVTRPLHATHTLTELPRTDAFQRFTLSAPERCFEASVTQLREARPVPPVSIGGAANAAVQPLPETFGNAAAWRIELPADALSAPGLANVHVEIDYVGDISRLFSANHLIDDHFYNGLPWRVSARHVAIDPHAPLVLTILPLRADAPIYLDSRFDPRPCVEGQIAELTAVTVVPEYEVAVR